MTGAGVGVRMLSALLWVLVALGPLLGGVALLRPLPQPPSLDGDGGVPVGVAGVAEMAVLAHITTLPGEVATRFGPALPGLRVRGSALDGLSGEEQAAAARQAGQPVAGVATIEVTPAGPQRWGVTVVVLRGGTVEGWQVTLAASPQGLLVETLPALVGLPDVGGAAPVPAVPPLRPPVADDPLATAVSRFVSALLTGDGELSRYLAPDADVVAPPLLASRAELRRLSAAPIDEDRMAVLAEVRVIRTDGSVHVAHYPLLLHPADGRWEVDRLLPALPVRPAQPPITDPSNP